MTKHVRRLILSLLVIAIVLVPVHLTKARDANLKIAYIYQENLWIHHSGQTTQVTEDAEASHPIWSHDGRWVAFHDGGPGGTINVYDLRTKELHTITTHGSNMMWSPTDDILAYQSNNILKVAKTEQLSGNDFKNLGVSLGVANYSWQPDGKGFLVSSNSRLLPTGWDSVKLFKVPLNANMNQNRSQLFYSLPEQSADFFAVGTSSFKWSPTRKWIAFIAHPTASASADSNTLAVLSKNADTFIQLDKMLLNPDWFKWAPVGDKLAYIDGTGRFAVKNKQLSVKEMPAANQHLLTPKGFVDRDFTWISPHEFVVSRAEEQEWKNSPEKRALPKLFYIDSQSGKQKPFTQLQKGWGDFAPTYLPESDQLLWVRSNRNEAGIWLADEDGNNVRQVVEHIDASVGYYEAYDWHNVMSTYRAEN